MSDGPFRQTTGQPGVPPLSHLYFFLTHGCSLACRRCWNSLHSPGNEAECQALPIDRIGTAIREALPLGLRAVRLCGGEPLQYPDFDLLLDHLESLELGVEMETTGLGLTPVRAARLARMPQCAIAIGLDGADAATHDTLHQQPGAFDLAARAVYLLATAGLAPQIVTTVLRRNVAQIPAILHLAEDLGAASVRFTILNSGPLKPSLNGGNHISASHNNFGNGQAGIAAHGKPEFLSIEELIALGRRIERDLASTTFLRLMYEQPPAFRGLYPRGHITSLRCHNVLNKLGVLPSGEYGLCGLAETSAELVFGQVGAVPLAQIWNTNPTLHALRQGMPDHQKGVCRNCAMKSACLGNCPTENFLQTGSFWGPYWFCAAAEQAGLFPAGRIIENNW